MKIAATVRITISEMLAPSGMSLPWMPIQNNPGGEHMGAVERAAGGEMRTMSKLAKVTISEQRGDRHDVRIIRIVTYHALPPVGAVDGGGS
jgi:hypothetical protein